MPSVDKLPVNAALQISAANNRAEKVSASSFAMQFDAASARIRAEGIASGKMLNVPVSAPRNPDEIVGRWLQAMNNYHLQNGMSTASDMAIGLNFMIETAQKQQSDTASCTIDPQALILASIRGASKREGGKAIIQDVQQFFDSNGISFNLTAELAKFTRS
ncbi:hypothetical protein [Chitinimonas sp.]|uniref:hypothetical protein n=1 Tax=Chitinimonas sp. TaxID=1934313 RepID=UPI0035AF4F2A